MDFGLSDLAFIIGTGTEAIAKKESGDYKEKIAEFNAQIANEHVDVAMARGRQQETQLRREYDQLQGKQRVMLAAQGADLEDFDSSAGAIQLDTRRQEEIDVLTLRNNVALESWGYKVQAFDYTNAGKMAEREGNMAAFQTVLTGAADYAFATGSLGSKKSRSYITRGYN